MLRVISDLHIGAVRSNGTTPATQWQLRQHILSQFKELLPVGDDLMILGDAFDTANIAISDVLSTYFILRDWLAANPESTCYGVCGNHDNSKSSHVLSSFDFLCALLAGPKFVAIKQPMMTPYGYVVPHLPNQADFDAALVAVPECAVLFLHCNYDNKFAAQSDNSLNISKEQALAAPAQTIVIGHEHKARRAGKVVLPGNQIASSVSDWINQVNKLYTTVESGVVTLHPIVRQPEFVELHWRALTAADHFKFIRVVGNATVEEAAAVVTAISKFRQTSPALVITNAVVVASEDSTDTFENALESVQAFSVMAALAELLTVEEMAIIGGLDA